MTKLEAWQAWCATAGTKDLATEFTLEQSSHGKAFSFAWDEAAKAEREVCAKVCEEFGAMPVNMSQAWRNGCFECATEIRARGNT